MKNNKVQHFRLTIAKKLLLGFLSCGLLTILSSKSSFKCSKGSLTMPAKIRIK